MSSRIRFASARNVFEAFPDLGRVVTLPADDPAPLDYLRALMAAPSPNAAVVFLAHLLPRREATWWAIQCVRAMLGAGADDEALRAADAWVRTPEEDTRRAALAAYNGRDPKAPTTWLAYAAGWSGGSVTGPDKDPMPAPPRRLRDGGADGGHPGGLRRRPARRRRQIEGLRGSRRSLRRRGGRESAAARSTRRGLAGSLMGGA